MSRGGFLPALATRLLTLEPRPEREKDDVWNIVCDS